MKLHRFFHGFTACWHVLDKSERQLDVKHGDKVTQKIVYFYYRLELGCCHCGKTRVADSSTFRRVHTCGD